MQLRADIARRHLEAQRRRDTLHGTTRSKDLQVSMGQAPYEDAYWVTHPEVPLFITIPGIPKA